MMDIKQIILHSIYGNLNKDESRLLEQWFLEGNHKNLYERIYCHLTAQDAVRFLADIDTERALSRVKRRIRRPKIAMVSFASGIAAVLFIGLMFLAQFTEKPDFEIEPACPTITLATGEVLRLDGATINHQSDAADICVAGDTIQVNAVQHHVRSTKVLSNVLRVPHGESFSVTLPDGSCVWVNALSALKFPSTFEGMSDRTVEISGEAYFEVACDSAHPFLVIAAGQIITVTGTTFNVAAYDNEIMRTTLCSGSVLVKTATGKELNLSPGEQLVTKLSGETMIEKVDTEVYTAWMRGEYYFDNQVLEEVFTVLAKWFDISSVSFIDATMKQRVFSGKFKKSDGIHTILEVIEKGSQTKINYKNERIVIGMN